jgi:lipopolysaccharide/colanic/teichoic acid biosynthesis glycosyltransferase
MKSLPMPTLTQPSDRPDAVCAIFRARVSNHWYLPFKNTVDFALAVALLICLAPLILFLMALVRLTSAGPALYWQVRLGLNGRSFRIYKLRTMAHECERLTGPRWSTAGDPRVTRLGRVLRRCHLDELPQLWNVLRGEMSLVGPRPERPEIVQELERVVPEYRERITVRPGITGLAQVQLPPDEDVVKVRRKVACDLYYIARMGPWLDVRILAATVLKVAGVPAAWRRSLFSRSVGPVDAAQPEPAHQLDTLLAFSETR